MPRGSCASHSGARAQRRACTAARVHSRTHPPTPPAAAAAHMITEDFVTLTSAGLHSAGVVLEDRSTREHLRVHSLQP